MTIRPIRPEDITALQQHAAEDAHLVVAPTHVCIKDNELVGYFSVARVPLILTWLSTRKVKAIDSIKALRKIEDHCTMSNIPVVCIPCATDSPFYPEMEKLGYIEAPMMRFFFKKLL